MGTCRKSAGNLVTCLVFFASAHSVVCLSAQLFLPLLSGSVSIIWKHLICCDHFWRPAVVRKVIPSIAAPSDGASRPVTAKCAFNYLFTIYCHIRPLYLHIESVASGSDLSHHLSCPKRAQFVQLSFGGVNLKLLLHSKWRAVAIVCAPVGALGESSYRIGPSLAHQTNILFASRLLIGGLSAPAKYPASNESALLTRLRRRRPRHRVIHFTFVTSTRDNMSGATLL